MGVYETFQQSKVKTGTSVYSQFQQSKVAPKSGGLISGVANFVSKPITFMADQIQSAFQSKAKTDLNQVRGMTTEIAKTWKDTVVDTSKRFNLMMDAWQKPGKNDKVDVAVKTAQAGLGAVNTFFAPITGTMKGLETHPVFGWPAAAVNGIFMGIGEASSEVGLKTLEKSPFSEETKTKLRPLVSETFALAGMIAAGKGGEVTFSKLRANTNTILETVKSEAPKPSTEPGKGVFTQYAKETGRQIETKPADYTTFKSETALKLQDEARARGIVFDADVPVQQRMSLIENLKTAEDIVKADPARAERFLTREEPLPPNVEVGSIYKALKQKALAEADAGLIERLSRTTAGTESARALKSFDDGVRLVADPVEAVAEVRQARLEAAIGRQRGLTIEKAVKEAKASVGKIARPNKQTWAEFIKSIEC